MVPVRDSFSFDKETVQQGQSYLMDPHIRSLPWYYINQLSNPSFPVGLVKTESDFVVRSAETGLGRWMLLVAVISVVLTLFWLSQTWPVNLRIQELVFSCCTVLPDSKESKFGNSDQEASPSASKNTEIILVSHHAWKCVLTAISSGVDISEVPGCHFLW